MGEQLAGNRTIRKLIRRCVGSGLVLLILCGALPGADVKTGAAPGREPTAAELKSQVMTLAGKGKLTDELIARFKNYAWRQAVEKLKSEAPKEFWTWASANRTIRDGLILALHPDYNPHIVRRLHELKRKFGGKVDEYAHLALAFAVVFGEAGEKPPWAHVTDYTKEYLRDDRKPPTMVESFAYYLKHRKHMRFPLRKTPWPMLIYVADNETPIEERLWALKNYAKMPDKPLARIIRDVQWKMEKLVGKWSIGDLPRTLENLREYGGVCAEQAYFTSHVYKSLGVPAMVEVGGSWRGYHASVGWVVDKKKRYTTDKEGYLLTGAGGAGREYYFSSKTFSPVVRKMIPSSDLALLVAAMRHSYRRYVDAAIGCAAYRMFDGDDRKGKTRLLTDAVRRNPYCGRAWRLLGQACVDGILTGKQGEHVVDSMIKTLESSPALTFEVLEKILSPQLKTGTDVPGTRIRRNLRVLDRALVLYDRLRRDDLGIKLVMLKGDYLIALGRTEQARKLYMLGTEKYLRKHTGFVRLFNRALELMKGDENRTRRLRFVDRLATTMGPPPPYMFCGPGATAYTHLIQTYIDELRDAGRDKLAEKWETKLRDMKVR